MFISLKVNQNLTMRDNEEVNIQGQLDAQITNQEMKDTGWRYNEIHSMTTNFYKTNELNGSSYVKIPLRGSCVLNIEIDDKYCFLCIFLAHPHPCQNSHPNWVSNYRQLFIKFKIDGFDFTNGFRTCDVVKFENLKKLSINIFELQFYKVIWKNHQWKHKLIPIEVSKNNSERVIDLMIYKNHYVLIKTLHVFLGKKDCKFVCRRCLTCYRHERVWVKHKKDVNNKK